MDDNRILMKETLETVVDYIGKMLDNISIITEDIQAGRENKGILKSIELCDGFRWLIDALTLTKPMQKEIEAEIDISVTNDIFIQIIDALENRDYVLLSDLLEYELSPIIVNWKDILAAKMI